MTQTRITQLLASAFSAAALMALSVPAQAAPLTPATAEGDSYGAQVIASIGGLPPVTVGPIAPSYATVPPGVTVGSQSGTVVAGPNAPLPPVLNALNVTNDTSKATLTPVATTDCQPNQTLQDGNTGPMSGGNACSTIASVEALNTGTALAPVNVVSADGIFTQSITQQCDPSQGLPTGTTVIVDLTLGGTPIVIPPGGFAPNTELAVPGLAKVILNEQKLENLSGGQGLTVNAIHIITDPAIAQLAVADVIIGHSHSNASCTTPPAKEPCAVALDPTLCHGVLISKTDNTGTETAKPGQTITYTLKLTNDSIDVPCKVTLVTDTLPPGFTYVSSSGPLGMPVSVVGQVVKWFIPAPGLTLPATETIVAQIAANEPDGFFSNLVETLSSGGPGCGDNTGSSPPIHNIVTPPTTPPNNGNGNAGAGQKLPFTSTKSPDASIWLGVILLGLVISAVAATRVLREGPID